MSKKRLQTETHVRDDVGLLHLKFRGSINIEFSDSFAEFLDSALAHGHGKIILDFNDVDMITSNGLRNLLVFAKKAKKENKKFVICNMQDAVRKIFELSGFLEIFATAPTHEKALEMLGQ